eukprot:1236993-Rhodomonas_salina.3
MPPYPMSGMAIAAAIRLRCPRYQRSGRFPAVRCAAHPEIKCKKPPRGALQPRRSPRTARVRARTYPLPSYASPRQSPYHPMQSRLAARTILRTVRIVLRLDCTLRIPCTLRHPDPSPHTLTNRNPLASQTTLDSDVATRGVRRLWCESCETLQREESPAPWPWRSSTAPPVRFRAASLGPCACV